ncbi:UbiA prenyltransferase family protein [Candidatus Microgenomates bacterium]|nr:UbiA prenyltransferase family protein [Candidatus Microgenomates bacterium]
MKIRQKAELLVRELRVNQWIKNLIVFTAIIFSGELFSPQHFLASFWAFCILCLLSSTSYVLNDIIDYPYDKKHPVKKYRPIASGKISIQEATFIVFIMTIISLLASLLFSIQFFLLSLTFILLHFFYSLYLKRYPIIDIFSISLSFMIRAFSGVVATGFHIPIWLMFTIFFGSLFVATVKRDAELLTHGSEARISMSFYKEHLLNFLTTTFATSTILAYSFYTYFERLTTSQTEFTKFFTQIIPDFEARKWMMLSIPFVVYGIARYAQLLYDHAEGERPEKIITKDKPLITAMGLWALTVVLLLYIL